jgi:hypothetical protein
MNRNNSKVKKKPKFSLLEKLFYLAVIGGTIFLIINGYNDYKQIMNNPKIVRGVIYDVKLYSGGNGNYRWNIYFNYKVNDEFYNSKLIDQSTSSKNFSIGDSLYVYVDNYNNEKVLAFKNPIKTPIRPNIIDFMRRDSMFGYLLILVILVVLISTVPVLIHFLYIVLAGLLLKIIDKNRADLFFEKGFETIKQNTIAKIDDFIDRW